MSDSITVTTPSDCAVGSISYPADLPVVAQRETILAALARHQVLVIAGETGSGKTTQLPKLCLEALRGTRGMIGHTQPRRLAARTVAQRIASELSGSIGDLVGFQVRFSDQVSEDTRIKLMTDGILLAEIQRDRQLRRYDTLIIDEAHERSLNIDFLLGYLKRLLPKRPDLKLIITSATIDVQRFAEHFGDAPVLEVSGRSHPVQTHYLPPPDSDDSTAYIAELVEAIDAGQFGERGDVLVFLSGEREIREQARVLRHLKHVDVLPLYARLSQAEQQRVFDLKKRRGLRVVLSTNVAETSLTVPGIRYVIDPGDARISRYSYRTKLQRLPVERISQASANQRQGRCGRVGPGVCLRLYSEDDFNARPEYTDPEIKRTNLAAVILQMLRLNLGEVAQFPFVEPPDSRMVRDGYKLLEELGAVSTQGKLTGIGKQMAKLPVDPRLARMVLAARDKHCVAQVLVIATALAVQDPRERPADKQQQADQQHARFKDERSDFVAWLNLWQYYEQQRQALSQNQLRKLCKKEFLSFMRMREWRDIHYQLSLACRQLAIRVPRDIPEALPYDQVHQSLLYGLLGYIGQLDENGEYLGARGRKWQIFPGSSQFKKRPKWVVAGEIVETSKVYARQVARIDPGWVLDANPQLLKRHYYHPRWQARSGRVMAYERVSLYGLTVADKRSVHYGPIAPVESRELLIREALVAGNCRPRPSFVKRNFAAVREIEALESRIRRRDLLVDEETLFRFYDELLPEDIYTLGRLQGWLKRQPDMREQLIMPRSLLQVRDTGDNLAAQFPHSLRFGELEFALSYHFEPGHPRDGVSVKLPALLLNRVPRHRFDYLVPGMLAEKCVAMVRALPKATRKHLVPVPDTVARALLQFTEDDRPLSQALADALSHVAKVKISASELEAARLEDYYRMHYQVIDAEGKVIAQGRELMPLIEGYQAAPEPAHSDAQSIEREGITRWDFDTLPEHWQVRQGKVKARFYPALVDEGTSVAIRLCDYPEDAARQSFLGAIKLARLNLKDTVKYLRKQLFKGNAASLALAGSGLDKSALADDVIDAALAEALSLQACPPRSKQAFEQAISQGRSQVVSLATDTEQLLLGTLRQLGDNRRLLAELSPAPELEKDVNTQLNALFGAGFVRDTKAQWLREYPRYMKALRTRLERYRAAQAKDGEHRELLASLQAPLDAALARKPTLCLHNEAASHYRWMLEGLYWPQTSKSKIQNTRSFTTVACGIVDRLTV